MGRPRPVGCDAGLRKTNDACRMTKDQRWEPRGCAVVHLNRRTPNAGRRTLNVERRRPGTQARADRSSDSGWLGMGRPRPVSPSRAPTARALGLRTPRIEVQRSAFGVQRSTFPGRQPQPRWERDEGTPSPVGGGAAGETRPGSWLRALCSLLHSACLRLTCRYCVTSCAASVSSSSSVAVTPSGRSDWPSPRASVQRVWPASRS